MLLIQKSQLDNNIIRIFCYDMIVFNLRCLVPEDFTIPSFLVRQIERGEVVLYLGAGASIGATHPKNHTVPIGVKLANLISDEFLDGEKYNNNLMWVSQLAAQNASYSQVQHFIADYLRDFEPASFHLEIPTYKWKQIVTVNYDDIIEKAYRKSLGSIQKLHRYVGDKDNIDQLLREENSLLYVKLHGCISRIDDPDLPLVITTQHYANARRNRENLYNEFETKALNSPVLFVGTSIQDYDLIEILQELKRKDFLRNQSYLVTPAATDVEKAMFQSEFKILVISTDFEKFINKLGNQIPRDVRSITPHFSVEKHPIELRLHAGRKLSPTMLTFLNRDVEYIHQGTSSSPKDPKEFYRGFDLGWDAIERNLDVPREISSSIISTAIEKQDADRPTITDLYAIKSPAGGGKSILLRRVAWEAALRFGKTCLFQKENTKVEAADVIDIANAVNERLFLFIDDTPEHFDEIEKIILQCRKNRVRLTIITASRTNEWDMYCKDTLDGFLTEAFELDILNNREVRGLLGLLEKHHSLGYLQDFSPNERETKLQLEAKRQLLVALLQATQGKQLEEIILDEYHSIHPQRAQELYMAICTLNRFNTPVRAGLISRSFGIPFVELHDSFWTPLKHVIQAKKNTLYNEYLYSTRHPLIADVVFDRILETPDQKLDYSLRIMSSLNLSYEIDREAFHEMIKFRKVKDTFEPSLARQIFERAVDMSPKDYFVYHQYGLYEMNHPRGDLIYAEQMFQEAKKLKPTSSAIAHSFAELLRERSRRSDGAQEKEGFRKQSDQVAKPLMSDPDTGRYAANTLIKNQLDRLREVVKLEPGNEARINEIINSTQEMIDRAKSMFPDEAYIRETEAEFYNLQQQSGIAVDALQKAFNLNKSNIAIAKRLAQGLFSQGQIEQAFKVLDESILTNHRNMPLFYTYAQLLMKDPGTPIGKLLYYLRNSFADGDTNYISQFWYARYAYEFGSGDDKQRAREIFSRLKESRLRTEEKRKIRAFSENENQKIRYWGTVIRCHQQYGFLKREDNSEDIYVAAQFTDSTIWTHLRPDQRVSFNIGFNFGGPIAINIETDG